MYLYIFYLENSGIQKKFLPLSKEMKTQFYTDKKDIEENALFSLKKFEDDGHIHNICVFPDIHYCSEKSLPIGVAFKTTNVFFPLITGKDMGCGVMYLRIPKDFYLKPFDNTKHYRAFEKASRSMTDEGLGGGNHFLSIEESEKYLYIIVHTGTRNLGIHQFQQNLGLLAEHNPGQEWLPIELATKEYVTNYNTVLNYGRNRREQFVTETLYFLQKNKYVEEGEIQNFTCEDTHHNSLEFTDKGVIHRKGATQLKGGNAVIPLSMSRGSLIVRPNIWDKVGLTDALQSCSHGAGRVFSRTDTLKHWYSMKKSERDSYEKRFPELLNRQGKFDSSLIQEFDFAYKNSDTILKSQPHLIKVDETTPIATVKFTAI